MTAVAPALAVAVAPALAALGPAGGVAAPPEWTRQPGGGRGPGPVAGPAGDQRRGHGGPWTDSSKEALESPLEEDFSNS